MRRISTGQPAVLVQVGATGVEFDSCAIVGYGLFFRADQLDFVLIVHNSYQLMSTYVIDPLDFHRYALIAESNKLGPHSNFGSQRMSCTPGSRQSLVFAYDFKTFKLYVSANFFHDVFVCFVDEQITM